MNRILSVLFVVVLVGCSSAPQVAEVPVTEGALNGFHSVANFQDFAEAYIKSPYVFSGYARLRYDTLKVDRLEIDTSRLQERTQTWTKKTDDAARVQSYFKDQVQRFYSKPRKFVLVDSAGGGKTLRVAVELVKYKPNAPRDTINDRDSGSVYFTEGAGRLYMVTRVFDAASGELLAQFSDDRELGSTWQKDDRANNTRRLKDGLLTWVSRIDEGLAMLR